MIDYRLYLVTDDPSRYRHDWLDTIAAAINGGVTCVQYRDTENPRQSQYARILKLQDLLKARKIPLVINNDAELAAAVRSEGVHVGQGDTPPDEVRAIVGGNCEIGLSITCESDLTSLRRHSDCVNCIGIGPVYDARKTKADASSAIGTDGLSAIIRRVPELPNCAIGGITPDNAGAVIAAGAKGIAIVSAFSQAPDPFAAAKRFSALLNQSL